METGPIVWQRDGTLSAMTHIPLADPYGRRPGDPLFRSRAPKQKIYDSGAARIKASKLIQNSMITLRDTHILQTLLGVGILSRHQMQRLFWPPGTSLSTINRRLKLLTDRGILLSTTSYFDLLSDWGLERCHVYGLEDVGREVLAIRAGQPAARHVAYNGRYYDLLAENRLIRHHLMTSEIYTRLKEKSVRAGNELLWLNEMAAHIHDGERELVRPDAYATIWREGFADAAHLFIETDTRHTEWPKKVQSYELARSHGNWRHVLGAPCFPLVLGVVPHQRAVHRVATLIQAQATSITYLLKAWPQFLAEDPYTGWFHVQGAAGEEMVKLLPDEMIAEQG